MSEFEREILKQITRRTLFKQVGYGLGGVALSSMLSESLMASLVPASQENPLAPRPPHFKAKAKNVIYLFMAGAPSHLDLFDPKPMLIKYDKQACPEEFLKGDRFAFIKGTPKLLGSPFKFEAVGKSGHMVSELLPHFKEIADEVAVIHSMNTEQFNQYMTQIESHAAQELGVEFTAV